MDKPILLMDIDATVYDSNSVILERVHQLTGDVIKTEEYTDYYYLFDRYGDQFASDVFLSVCADPAFMDKRPIYPNAVESIRELKEHYRVIFATQNGRPEQMYQPLKNWLQRRFGMSDLLMIPPTQPKGDVMMAIGAEIIVDDAPHTLRECFGLGFDCYTLIHPYNQEEVEDRVAVGFNNWSELPAMLIGEGYEYIRHDLPHRS